MIVRPFPKAIFNSCGALSLRRLSSSLLRLDVRTSSAGKDKSFLGFSHCHPPVQARGRIWTLKYLQTSKVREK
jgi:hypothetical protein